MDSAVRVQASITKKTAGHKDESVKEAVKLDSKDDIKQGKSKRKVNRKLCAIGVHLVNFLVERELFVN